VLDLDTPALVVDLQVLRSNIRHVSALAAAKSVRLHPDVSTHCCPAIAHEQIAVAGGGAAVAVTTLGEAEVFVHSGFRNVHIRNHVDGSVSIDRLVALTRFATMSVSVDALDNIRHLSDEAARRDTEVGVYVEVGTDSNWCGVEPGEAVAELSDSVHNMPGLRFLGLIARVSIVSDSTRHAEALAEIASRLETSRSSLARQRLTADRIMLDARGAYGRALDVPGVTDVVLGKYTLLDENCRRCCPQLQVAARILSTTISRPEIQRVVADAGQKTVGSDFGLPRIERSDARVVRLSAEHCLLDVDPESDLSIGTKVWLVPADIRMTASLHDSIYVALDGRIVAVWSNSARGRVQ
jgi:D-serine deaminase-like pyridoxal phosphate-dependent protein